MISLLKFKTIWPEQITLNGQVFNLEILICRQKTSTARIKDQVILIRLSKYLLVKQRVKVVEDLLAKISLAIQKGNFGKKKLNPLEKLWDWDLKKITLGNSKMNLGQLNLQNGASYFVFLTKQAQLKNIQGKIYGANLIIKTPDFNRSKRKKSWENIAYRLIAQDQKLFIKRLIKDLNQRFFEEKINQVSFKHTSSRWGSCSARRNLNFSVRLLFLPYELLEYVCIHELAHLKEMNHSPRFWKIVEGVLPDYKERRRVLRGIG